MRDVDMNGAAALGRVEGPYEQLVGHLLIPTDRDDFLLGNVDEGFQCVGQLGE